MSPDDLQTPQDIPPGQGQAPDSRPSAPDASQASPGESVEDTLNILCVRNMVLFPGVVLPISVGRKRSIEAVQEAVRSQKQIGLLLQKDQELENPTPGDLYTVGTAAGVLRYITAPDGSHHVICQGQHRFRVLDFVANDPYLTAKVMRFEEKEILTKDIEARFIYLKGIAREAIQLLPQAPQDLDAAIQGVESPSVLADMLATYMDLSVQEKQDILETFDLEKRLNVVSQKLAHRLEVLRLSRDISQQTRGSLEKAQREYYLREQLKTIQKELGEGDPKTVEMRELSEAIAGAKMPAEVEKEARKELSRLERMPEAAAEYSMIRTYLDWLIELPWSTLTEDSIDIRRAREILDEDHYGLEKVKKRIVEFLAVRKLKPGGRSAILCLVGPPGVGKTSLGQSIARATNRKFVRVSLGGVHDEAEVRGHRRTYIGSLPGTIIQAIRKAGSSNPVFMLDELDKLSHSFHGDPASALLEVLDPEQNNTFRDNYLAVPFDLSRVMFIGTANVLDSIPGPLRDRCEVIEMPGYTEEEKLEIARRYLVKRRIEENGLKPGQCEITDATLLEVIRRYTREAGVRNLEREIGAICRHVATKIAEGLGPREAEGGGPAAEIRPERTPAETRPERTPAETRPEKTPAEPPATFRIDGSQVAAILGPPRFESETALRTSIPGVSTGLAWTPTGGEILFVEATRMPGKGNLILTGQLGDVMKESAQAAVSLVKSHAADIGIDPGVFEKVDIHIHVPAGAIPKDGPSAGVTMYTALVSLLTGRTVRKDIAMTGEISLRGLVLPVGGIKEKVLGARSAEIQTVLLPARNKKDLDDIPAGARSHLNFVWLETVSEAIAQALDPGPAGPVSPPPP